MRPSTPRRPSGKKCGITEADEEEEKPPIRGRHHHHHHAACDIQKEVTAILVNMKGDSMTAAAMFSGEMKRGHKVQAVNPIVPMQRLMSDILGNVRTVLVVMTGLIIIVSGVGIFVSIYNSMSDRRKEIAIMPRQLGDAAAHRIRDHSGRIDSAVFRRRHLRHPVGPRPRFRGRSRRPAADGHFDQPVRLRADRTGAAAGTDRGLGFDRRRRAGAGRFTAPTSPGHLPTDG